MHWYGASARARTRTAAMLMAVTGVLTVGQGRPGESSSDPAAARPERLRVRVVRAFPHDRTAFTQGLLFHAGKLYESTGLVGHSSLRRVDPVTGAVEKRVPLERTLFGEGLARVGNELFQLTWKEGRAIVWSLETLKKLREYRYSGEGWGLCFDGQHLVMSDGSDRLARRDPRTFEKVSEMEVRLGAIPVARLNELECVDGSIYANIWGNSEIVRIDERSGKVTGWIDASGLLRPDEVAGTDVLNGIAALPQRGRFVVTGKLWPRAFEVELVPAR